MAENGSQASRLSGSTLKYMAKRVLAEFSRDGGTDQAAKLTYFMVLSIAPALLALFSLATLLLSDLTEQISGLIGRRSSRPWATATWTWARPCTRPWTP